MSLCLLSAVWRVLCTTLWLKWWGLWKSESKGRKAKSLVRSEDPSWLGSNWCTGWGREAVLKRACWVKQPRCRKSRLCPALGFHSALIEILCDFVCFWTGEPLELMVQFFGKFGDKPCCITDLKIYLHLLSPDQHVQVRRSHSSCVQQTLVKWRLGPWNAFLFSTL